LCVHYLTIIYLFPVQSFSKRVATDDTL